MIDVYVLNQELSPVGIVDDYSSLIWANRYNDVGDCEIAIAATVDNVALLQKGNYLLRLDDDMVCRINKIEIDTNADGNNQLIATGVDVKGMLDQRIIWNTQTCGGNLEEFDRGLITSQCISPTIPERQLKTPQNAVLLKLGALAGFTVTSTEQISYKNLGLKIREDCKANGWGYRVVYYRGVERKLSFEFYKGTDRSGYVSFCPEYDNLATSKYICDQSGLGNVALIGGEGEGAARKKQTFGTSAGVNRYEQFVDAKDLSTVITYKELTDTYPGGTVKKPYEFLQAVYELPALNVKIMDANHLAWLRSIYRQGYVDGKYYHIDNVNIAEMSTETPDDNTEVELRSVIYYSYLLERGATKIAESGEKVSFEGTVFPDVTFVYKQDYFLGDIVNVKNEFGITADARITEIIEVVNESGYSVEPKFEYIGG